MSLVLDQSSFRSITAMHFRQHCLILETKRYLQLALSVFRSASLEKKNVRVYFLLSGMAITNGLAMLDKVRVYHNELASMQLSINPES